MSEKLLEGSEQEGEPPSERLRSWNHPHFGDANYVDEEYEKLVKAIYASQSEEDREYDRVIEYEIYKFNHSLLDTEPIDKDYYEKNKRRMHRLSRRLAHTVDLLEFASSK